MQLKGIYSLEVDTFTYVYNKSQLPDVFNDYVKVVTACEHSKSCTVFIEQ